MANSGEVRRLTADPFERAAQREHHEELRQELVKQRLWRKMRRNGDGAMAAMMLAFFGVPYAIGALVRAAGFRFGEPTWGESLVDYFFGGRFWLFGAWTGFTLLMAWAALMLWIMARGD